jgi:putative cofactor-binding repeat protein
MITHFCKKFFILIFSLFAFFGSITAQNNFPIEQPSTDSVKSGLFSIEKGIFLTPTVAVGLATPYGIPFKAGLVLNAGAELCYMLSSHIGIAAGAQFERYAFEYHNDDYNVPTTDLTAPANSSATDTNIYGGGHTTANYKFEYVRIPLLLRYVTGSKKRVGLYAEAGVTADILVSASVSGNVIENMYDMQRTSGGPSFSYKTTSNQHADITGVTPDAAKFNIALHAGIGIIIPAGPIYLILAYTPDFRLLNGGSGDNDVVNFTNSKYYFFGQNSQYGSLNSHSLTIKLLFKL